jgi:transcriptional repressor NrdR
LPAQEKPALTEKELGRMKCPYCGESESKVIDSRPTEDGLKIRRRRECLSCQKRFTTYEIVETVPLMVVKKDRSRQAFDRQKLLNGMMRSCEKRPVSYEMLEHAVDNIEQTLLNSYDREVSSMYIGELAMEELKKIDEVAYVRFASVYRQFSDLNTFMDELKDMLDTRTKEAYRESKHAQE